MSAVIKEIDEDVLVQEDKCGNGITIIVELFQNTFLCYNALREGGPMIEYEFSDEHKRA